MPTIYTFGYVAKFVTVLLIESLEKIYQFAKPLKPGYNINANECYSTRVLQDLKQRISERGMIFDFPVYIRSRQINGSHVRNVIHRLGSGQQLTLMKYM
ncbi:MAG: hypothetical protein WCF97_04700 [Nitrososphaeraceae archaeon]